MTDIFDAKILCKNCGLQMKPRIVERNGLELRAVECPKCGDKIIHPADLNSSQQFNDLRGKTFEVKLRVVGNSHAISIPKEILEFMHGQEKTMKRHMDDMVRLCFEDFGRLSVDFFGDDDIDNEEHEDLNDKEDNSIDSMRIRKRRDVKW